MKKLLNILKNVLIIFTLIYTLLCLWLYLFPELFIFYPLDRIPNLEQAKENGYPAEVVTYKAVDGANLYAWHTKPSKTIDNGKIIVFMHGNTFNLEAFYRKLIPLANVGYATFLPEFRGYGAIDGKPSNKNIVSDAMSAMEEVYKLGYKNEDIVVYGMSLGSHMATSVVYNLKDKGKFDALVLEVPLSTVPNVAKAVFPIYMPFDFLLSKNKFDNLSIIPYVNTRVLFMATKKDKIVPYELALDLYKHAVEPKDIIIYDDVGHNDLYKIKNYKDIIKWLGKK